MQRKRLTYIPAFDGLRGVAVLPVVLLHVGGSVLPNSRLLRVVTRGWYSVDLFFVLSGFLITRILLREREASGTIDVGRFYLRRLLRLVPAYASMLAAVLVGAAVLDPHQLQGVPRVLPSILTGTYNYQIAAGGTHFNVLVVIWSLCVEEQFYMVWPLLLRRLDAHRGLWMCLAAIAAFSAYRTALYTFLNWGHLNRPTALSATWIYFATDTRIEVILIGCAMALSLENRRLMPLWRWARKAPMLSWSALALVFVCVLFVTGGVPSSASWRSATFGYTLAGTATATLVLAVFLQPSSLIARMLSWRPLVSLGAISYGVYLFHLPIESLTLRIGMPWLGANSVLAHSGLWLPYLIASGVVIALTWIVATIHYQCVERRVMQLRPAIRDHASADRTVSGGHASSDSAKDDSPASLATLQSVVTPLIGFALRRLRPAAGARALCGWILSKAKAAAARPRSALGNWHRGPAIRRSMM